MVVVQAEVDGPELGDLPPQMMRESGTTREECIHNVKIRAAQQTALFGADDVSEINVVESEVLRE